MLLGTLLQRNIVQGNIASHVAAAWLESLSEIEHESILGLESPDPRPTKLLWRQTSCLGAISLIFFAEACLILEGVYGLSRVEQVSIP